MAKATKRQALGRGLSALLNEDSQVNSTPDKATSELVANIIEIALDSIEANPYQPRSSFDREDLQELSSSIRELGLIQPITVRKISENQFQLVSGERRFRASKLIGSKTIPAYIRVANDQEMLEMALVENIQRKNLDPIEVALSYRRLIDEIQLTQEQMSLRVGKKRSTISNYLRLLKLDPIIQTGMRDGFITMGHGRALINVEKPEDQLAIYENILRKKLSVRQTELLVKSTKNIAIDKPVAKKQLPNYIKDNLKAIKEHFGNKIEVTVNSRGKGKLVIPFSSEQDFNRIKNLLKR